MPLSIFSSEKVRQRRQAAAKDLALFFVSFTVLAGTTGAFWALLPHEPVEISRPAPPGPDLYLAASGPAALDHAILLNGYFGSAQTMRAARVLLLGNSRLMFAMSQEDALQRLRRTFGNYYLLGFSHGEQDLFALDVIRKHDLHPRLVIVNADHFFTNRRSDLAAKVLRDSAFDVGKEIFEGNAAYRVRSGLHRLLPHWIGNGGNRVTVFRSVADGRWAYSPRTFAKVYPVRNEPCSRGPLPPEHLEHARRFQQEVAARGGRLVLTFVPSGEGNRAHAEQLAAHLQVPLVSPKLRGLETFDTSHFTMESAARFAHAFVEELEKALGPGPLPSYPAAIASLP